MPPAIIADRSLGMQMWMTKDLSGLGETYNSIRIDDKAKLDDVRNESVSFKKRGDIITGKAGMSSLAIAGESQRLRNVEGKAKLLGEYFGKGKDKAEAASEKVIGRNAEAYKVDIERMSVELARLSRKYSSGKGKPETGSITEAEIDLARRALKLTLVSREFSARVADTKDPPPGEAAKLALVNASLGMMNMIREGKLSDQAAADIIQGEVFDPCKSTDLLRLTVKTAHTARAQFVNADQLNATMDNVVAEVDKMLVNKNLSKEVREKLMDMKLDLRKQTDELINARLEASKRLDIKFDPVGKKDWQVKNMLKKASNDLRAWRFDMDSATGRLDASDKMERFRRKMDNVGRKGENRVSAQQFVTLAHMDSDYETALFNCKSLIAAAKIDITSRSAATNQIVPDSVAQSNPEFGFTDSAKTSETAGKQTHAANNYTRSFLNGTSKAARFSAEVHAMFDPLVANGGSKLVRFEVGGEVGGGIGAGGQGASLTGTAKFFQTAEISVKPGGGEVTVTYLTGGEAGLKLEANAGVSETVSVDASAEAKIGGAKGRTVTYASLDDFIRDTHGKTDLTQGMGTMYCLGRIAQGFRAIGRGVRNLLERTGLAMKQREITGVQNRIELQAGGTVGKLDTLLSGQITGNAVKTSEKTFDLFQTGLNAEATATIGVDNVLTSVGFGASAGIDHTRERNVGGREAQAFLTLVGDQSDAWLNEACEDIPPDRRIDSPRTAPSAESFARLEELIGNLNDRVSEFFREPHDRDMVDQFGRNTCAIVRDLSVQYEQIVRGMRDELAVARQQGRGDLVEDLTERLKLAGSVYGSQLRSTDLGIPQEIFDEELMVQTGKVESAYVTTKLDVSMSYDLTSGFAKRTVANTGTLAPSESDSIFATYGKSTGQMAEMLSVNNALGSNGLGLSGKIEAVITDRAPKNPNADRPWQRQPQTTISLRVSPSLPFRVLLEKTAGKYIEHHGGGKTQTAGAMMKEMGMGLLMSVLPATLIMPTKDFLGDLLMSNDSIADVVNKVKEWNAGNGVQVEGFDATLEMEKMKSVDFHFSNGRYEGVSLGNVDGMKSSIGIKMNAGLVKFGFNIGTSYSQNIYTRTLYEKPSMPTLLGKAAEYAHTGENAKLDNLLAQNTEGSLRLFNALKERDGVREKEDDEYFMQDGKEADVLVRNARTFADNALKGLPENDANKALGDRLDAALRKFDAANDKFARLPATAADEEKLSALADVLRASAACYELGHQAGQLEKRAA